MSTQPSPVSLPESLPALEFFVDPDTAANHIHTTRRHLLEMVREGLIFAHPLDPHAKEEGLEILAVRAARLPQAQERAASASTLVPNRSGE